MTIWSYYMENIGDLDRTSSLSGVVETESQNWGGGGGVQERMRSKEVHIEMVDDFVYQV